jgi:hypothetical protein
LIFVGRHFLHQHAFAIAMHLRPEAVFTKVAGDITPVNSELGNHDPFAERLGHDQDNQYGSYNAFHFGANILLITKTVLLFNSSLFHSGY